jgi:uncharacterized membrane protein
MSSVEGDYPTQGIFIITSSAGVISGILHLFTLGYCTKLVWHSRTRRNIGFVTLVAMSTSCLIFRLAEFWAYGIEYAELIASITMYLLRIFLILHFSNLLHIIVCISSWLTDPRISAIKFVMLFLNCTLSMPLLFPLIPSAAQKMMGPLIRMDASLLGVSDVVLSTYELLVLGIFSKSMYRNTLQSKNITGKHKIYVKKVLWGQFGYAAIVIVSLVARVFLLQLRAAPGAYARYAYFSFSKLLTFVYFIKFLLVPMIFINATSMRLGQKSETKGSENGESSSPEKPVMLKKLMSESGKVSETKVRDLETVKLA